MSERTRRLVLEDMIGDYRNFTSPVRFNKIHEMHQVLFGSLNLNLEPQMVYIGPEVSPQK